VFYCINVIEAWENTGHTHVHMHNIRHLTENTYVTIK